ncbi:hypothetical protein D3C86_1200130 [compost metagenome]
MILPSPSAATANLPRHSLTENLFSVSMLSVDTPMTVAPSDLYSSVASAKLCASMVQPCVNAAGKKYSTTGPCLSASFSLKVKTFPPSEACVLKSGAGAPTFKAAWAEAAASRPQNIRQGTRRFMGVSNNQWGARRSAARGLL